MSALASSLSKKLSSLSRRKTHTDTAHQLLIPDIENGEFLSSDACNTVELNEKQESEMPPIEYGHIYEISKTVRESTKSKVISLGLVHLGIQSPGEVCDEAEFKSIEGDNIKEDAKRRMFEESGQEEDKCHTVVLKLMPEIKSFYPNTKIDESDEELAKLVVRDACFLLQALFLLTREESWSDWREISSQWPRLGIFQQKHGNVKRDAVLQDILKLENQIPLFVLKEVANCFEDWAPEREYEISRRFSLQEVLKELSPIDSCSKKIQYINTRNLLCLLRDYMIENPGKEAYEAKAPRNPNSWWRYIVSMSVLTVQVFLFVFFRLVISMANEKRSVEALVLVASLSLSTIISLLVALLGSTRYYGTNLQSRVVSLRTRIRIRACKGGIESIEFKTTKFNLFNLGTLYLPSIELNDTTEVILSNMVAFEISRASGKKSVTNYVRLMDQLIHSRYDVRVMVSDGIIKYNGWGRKKVRQLWQDLSQLSQRQHGWSDLRIDNVDRVRGELHKISNLPSCNLRVIIRILFYDVIDRFCSKPWIALSTMAAITMLLLTGAQVLCLFYKCSAV